MERGRTMFLCFQVWIPAANFQLLILVSMLSVGNWDSHSKFLLRAQSGNIQCLDRLLGNLCWVNWAQIGHNFSIICSRNYNIVQSSLILELFLNNVWCVHTYLLLASASECCVPSLCCCTSQLDHCHFPYCWWFVSFGPIFPFYISQKRNTQKLMVVAMVAYWVLWEYKGLPALLHCWWMKSSTLGWKSFHCSLSSTSTILLLTGVVGPLCLNWMIKLVLDSWMHESRVSAALCWPVGWSLLSWTQHRQELVFPEMWELGKMKMTLFVQKEYN